MNLSAPFVRRPIGTVLLTVGVALAGVAAFFLLPVSPLPQVDFPTISVQAQLPGASPETMATSVADAARAASRPHLRRHRDDLVEPGRADEHHPAVRPRPQHRRRRARRAGGDQRRARRPAATLQVQPHLPQGQPGRRADPGPGADLEDPHAAARSTTRPRTSFSSSSRQVKGVGDVAVGGGLAAGGAGRAQSGRARPLRHRAGGRARGAGLGQRQPAQGRDRRRRRCACRSTPTTPDARPADYAPLLVAYRNGSAVRLSDVAQVVDGVEDVHNLGRLHQEGGRPAGGHRRPSS